jgi:hypothetical protein
MFTTLLTQIVFLFFQMLTVKLGRKCDIWLNRKVTTPQYVGFQSIEKNKIVNKGYYDKFCKVVLMRG